MSAEGGVRAAIFDFDGTLADSMYLWDDLPCELIRRHGGTPPADLAHAIAPLVLDDALEWIRDNCLPQLSVEQIRKELYDEITQHYQRIVPPKPGAKATLERLKARGVRMCVLSATDSELVCAALERFGFMDMFEFVAYSDDWGGKAYPECYLAAARRLGAEPAQTLVYEDALHAARTAHAAGFRVVGVYDVHSDADWPELKRISEWHCRELGPEMGERG